MATTKKTADSKPFDRTLASFIKEAEKEASAVEPCVLDTEDVNGKHTRITFKSPDQISTKTYMTVFGGGLDSMQEADAVAFFLNTMLSDEDRETYLNSHPEPSILATTRVMEYVQKHYEDQVPTPGESSASSD